MPASRPESRPPGAVLASIGPFAVLIMGALAASGCSDDAQAPSVHECARDGDCTGAEVCRGGSCTSGDLDVGGAGDTAEPDPARPCTSCTSDDSCGRAADLCVMLADGPFCGRDCKDDPAACPDGTECQAVSDRPDHEGALQCLPSAGQCVGCIDRDQDGFGSGDRCQGPDCDDANANVNPSAAEECNGVDDNCDDAIDEGFDLGSIEHCGACNQRCAPPNTAEAACVESLCTVVACPDGFEDCDGDVSNGCEATPRPFFRDGDEDGYGRDDSSVLGCSPPEGYVARGGDCNDLDGEEHPGAGEICDDLDNDCDNGVDEAEDLDAPPAMMRAGVCAGLDQVCNGFLFVEPDYLGVEHFEEEEHSCDGRDNDCDGETDEGCPPCLVPLRYANAQEAADARCTEIYIQPGAPRNLDLRNPPEDVVILPAVDGVVIAFFQLRLDEGNPRSVRVEGFDTQGVSAINSDRQGSIEFRNITVRDIESNAPLATLAGFNLTVRASTFENNVVTTGSRTGIVSLSEAREFRLLSNVFRGNAIVAQSPAEVSGAVYIEGDLSEGLISGNLFAANTAHGDDAAGALYATQGVRNVRLWNNTFAHNVNDLNIQASSVRCAGMLGGSDFRNNIMWFGSGRHIDGCVGAAINYSDHQTETPAGTGNLTADPQFVDEVNYALDTDSPCRDRGDPADAHRDPDTSRNDMGHTGGPYGR